jgi:two-component system, chemotaxis family, protein-glutamate methylesterase/glutaminase
MSCQFVAVGTSLGGFRALQTLLGALPKEFSLPVGIVQHRSHEDSESLTPLLASEVRLPVVEVSDKETIQEGHIYIGPPNYHLLVDEDHFDLSMDAPVMHARPSIDVFFESAAESFRDGVIGILLTGMSRDGTCGLDRIKQAGGYIVVQDPAEAEGQIMPKAAISSMNVDRILRLEEIASFLIEVGQRSQVKV